MRSVRRLRLSPRGSRLRALPALALAVSCVVLACGHLGIELEDGGFGDEGLAGGPPAGSGGSDAIQPASGGASSGGAEGSGGDEGAGGKAGGSGGASGGAGSGGVDGSGGTSAGGGTGSSGGAGSGGSGGGPDGGGGVPGSGGGGGSGGATAECELTDALCAELEGALVHRYSFDGTGTVASDAIAGEDATLVGTVLDGSGAVTLAAATAYVALPSGLLSSLPGATIEVWFAWQGGQPWQKVFEFGDEDFWGDPTNYVYVTPLGGGTVLPELALAAGMRMVNGGDRQLRTTSVTAPGVLTHVGLILDDAAERLSIFKNGQWLAARDTEVDLSRIQDATSRLGRSLFDDDPAFNGTITEFRIYGAVLSADALAQSYAEGPDVAFTP